MIEEAVILAAGAGKRLAPLTPSRSKAMAPVAGRPLVARVMDLLRAAGISRFLIVAALDDDECRRYFASDKSARVIVQPAAAGAADALLLAKGLLQGSFLVSACDSLPPAAHVKDLLARHREHGGAATLSVIEVSPSEDLGARSVAMLDGQRVVQVIEKPPPSKRLSDISCLPMYVFREAIFSALEQTPPSQRGEHEILPAVQLLIDRGSEISAVRAVSREQVTSLEDLLRLSLALFPAASEIAPDARVAPGSAIRAPVIIESGAQVDGRASVGPRVLVERGARIEAGASVRDAIIGRGVTVRSGESVAMRAVFNR